MRYYTHIIAGITFYLIYSLLFSSNVTLAGLLCSCIASVLPDVIDNASGKHRGIGHSLILVPFLAFFGLFRPHFS